MNVKRYFAQTAREALRQLKEELGADAIVLSNRSLDGGVEIVALPADAVELIHQSQAQRPAPAPRFQAPQVTAKVVPAQAKPAARALTDDDAGDYRVQLNSARRQQAEVLGNGARAAKSDSKAKRSGQRSCGKTRRWTTPRVRPVFAWLVG